MDNFGDIVEQGQTVGASLYTPSTQATFALDATPRPTRPSDFQVPSGTAGNWSTPYVYVPSMHDFDLSPLTPPRSGGFVCLYETTAPCPGGQRNLPPVLYSMTQIDAVVPTVPKKITATEKPYALSGVRFEGEHTGMSVDEAFKDFIMNVDEEATAEERDHAAAAEAPRTKRVCSDPALCSEEDKRVRDIATGACDAFAFNPARGIPSPLAMMLSPHDPMFQRWQAQSSRVSDAVLTPWLVLSEGSEYKPVVNPSHDPRRRDPSQKASTALPITARFAFAGVMQVNATTGGYSKRMAENSGLFPEAGIVTLMRCGVAVLGTFNPRPMPPNTIVYVDTMTDDEFSAFKKNMLFRDLHDYDIVPFLLRDAQGMQARYGGLFQTGFMARTKVGRLAGPARAWERAVRVLVDA